MQTTPSSTTPPSFLNNCLLHTLPSVFLPIHSPCRLNYKCFSQHTLSSVLSSTILQPFCPPEIFRSNTIAVSFQFLVLIVSSALLSTSRRSLVKHAEQYLLLTTLVVTPAYYWQFSCSCYRSISPFITDYMSHSSMLWLALMLEWWLNYFHIYRYYKKWNLLCPCFQLQQWCFAWKHCFGQRLKHSSDKNIQLNSVAVN